MTERKIRVDSKLLLWLAAAILLIPLKWLLSWILAGLIHEVFHIAFLLLFRCPIRQISLGINGTIIETEQHSITEEIVCSLAGPIGSFSTLLLVPWMPSVSICGAIQGAFNLLPLYPLDGGRIMKQILYSIIPAHRSDNVERVIAWLTYTVLAIFAMIILQRTGALLPLLAAGFIIWKDWKNSLQKQL